MTNRICAICEHPIKWDDASNIPEIKVLGIKPRWIHENSGTVCMVKGCDCRNPQPKAPPVGSAQGTKKYPSCDAPIGQFCKKHQCIHTVGSAEIRILKEAEPKLKSLGVTQKGE